MTARKLRLLADCLDEFGFYPDTDRHKWATDLRGMAKDLDRLAEDGKAEITARGEV